MSLETKSRETSGNPLRFVATQLTQYQKGELASNYHNLPYQTRSNGAAKTLSQEVVALNQVSKDDDTNDCVKQCQQYYKAGSYEYSICVANCQR